MTAQYKPYKDQEDFDEDQNDDNWGDRGRVEIFDKSPAPRSKRSLIIGGIAIAVIAVLVGVMIGYFGHTRHSSCKYRWSVALHSIMEADPSIRKKIIDEVSADEIKTTIRMCKKSNYPLIKFEAKTKKGAAPYRSSATKIAALLFVLKQHAVTIPRAHIDRMLVHATKTTRIAGFPESEPFVRYLKDKWDGYGIETEIKSYNVLLNYAQVGKPNKVQILKEETVVYNAGSITINGSKRRYVAEMDPIAAYSKSGEVISHVYGEYCFPNTLEGLQKIHKVSINGTILICRQLRDNIVEKAVRAAENFGAAGVLFYMDPKDIGRVPAKSKIPSDAVGMTNARYTPELFGDPLTPGYPSLDFTYRMDQKDVNLPKILVQPISADDAYNILNKFETISVKFRLSKLFLSRINVENLFFFFFINFNSPYFRLMGGVKAMKHWEGGFNIDYNLGPGFIDKKMKLKMTINNVYQNATIKNVIGTIKGFVEPDRYVVIGGHHDSWRYGAIDNAGGIAVISELVRVYGKLVQDGWKPRRTIIFASWDANGFGRIGSTEWVEENLKILKERAIAYLNVDSVVTGTDAMVVSGSTLLMNAAFNATREVANPDENAPEDTVYKQWLSYNDETRDIDSMIFSMYAESHVEAIAEGKHEGAGLLSTLLKSATDPRIPHYGNLVEVSDWQPFLKNLGVPVLAITYLGEAKNHTIHRYDTKYDTFENLQKIDRSFKYHKAVTQVYGEILRNLADNLFIPFNLLDYAQHIHEFFLYQAINEKSKWLQNGIDIDILSNTLNNFTNAALMLHIQQELAVLSNPMAIRKVNDQLLLLERTFLDVNFLPKDSIARALNIAMGNVSNLSSNQDNAALLDIVSSGLNGVLTTLSYRPFKSDWDLFRMYYSIVVSTLQSAIKALA
ncbi:N-acetylated-alpha-linked acidic dipeptidase 2 [Nymphon striatum]|nr:N-acetylated-alpha-linked acidic dipeptidase 2 [Nymphon striatum]